MNRHRSKSLSPQFGGVISTITSIKTYDIFPNLTSSNCEVIYIEDSPLTVFQHFLFRLPFLLQFFLRIARLVSTFSFTFDLLWSGTFYNTPRSR